MNTRECALLAVLILCAIFIAVVSCVNSRSAGNDDDVDFSSYHCDKLVGDPIKDCSSLCNQDNCSIMLQCGGYFENTSLDDCLKYCSEGCDAGCYPVGTMECLAQFSDCKSLTDCLTNLF